MPNLEHHRAGAAGGGTAGAGAAPAAGKRARTEALPAREPRHHEMTDVPLVDLGTYCENEEESAGDEGCFLEEGAADHLLTTIAVDALAVSAATYAAIAAVKDDIRGAGMEWGLQRELLFMITSAAITGGFSLAFAGSAIASRIDKAAATLAKGVRAEIMHGGKAPTTDAEFLTHLQDLEQPTAQAIVQSMAAGRFTHRDMLAVHRALTDPAVFGGAAIRARVRTQLAGFRDNRVAQIGNEMFGREVAVPVLVTYRRATYLVLCESYGIRGMAAGLNGANNDLTNDDPINMDSLVFVKVIGRGDHALALTAWGERRKGEPTPRIDLNTRAGRRSVRWESTFRLELDHAPDPTSLSVDPGDPDAADPFDADHVAVAP